MAVPELVFCPSGDGFKKYPGGVIAVAASDFLSTARGTLSTEADALSAGGTVVRDTQTVNNIRTNTNTAYQAADDTLEISGLPFVDLRYYDVWLTLKVEGYTDVTDGPLLRTQFTENYLNGAVVGVHTSSEASNQRFATAPPELSYFRALGVARSFRWFTGDSWFIRLAAESGTTFEWLLDQVIFIPANLPNGTDFPQASGATLGLAANTQDGDDGGDDHGKFTWFSGAPLDGLTSRGDYQRKGDGDDAEYFSEVTVPDGLTFWFSPFGAEQGPAWMYSMHTAMYRGERTWTEETFANRTTSGQDMGISPEGYGYDIGSSAGPTPNEAFCDGAGQAIIRLQHSLGIISIAQGSPSVGTGTQNQGIRHQLQDQFSWRTIWEWTDGTLITGGAVHRLSCADGTEWGTFGIEFQMGPGAFWMMFNPVTGYGSTHDISTWFTDHALVGTRIEVSRYRVRMRVWDASGAEPSTWDEDYFLESSSDSIVYPYGDSETIASKIRRPIIALGSELEGFDGFQPDFPVELTFHEWLVEHDPYGDPADMTARVERPPATSLGDQVIPFGSSYFVYWGKRDWTDDDGFGDNYLEFSVKVWNDPAAAEIQRAEVGEYYFYWFDEPFKYVSMNWRAAMRHSTSRRTLAGG